MPRSLPGMLLVASLSAGCQLVFPLHDRDAGSSTDDKDGSVDDGPRVIDAVDLDANLIDAAVGCWSAQTGDEDGDSIEDGCDFCPADNPNGPDDDGDGIPTVCDPHPNNATVADRIVYFEGFHTTPGGWTFIGGSWQLKTDALEQSRADFALAVLEVPFTNATVQVKLDALSTPTIGASTAGAYVNAQKSATDKLAPPGLVCSLVIRGGQSPQFSFANIGSGDGTSSGQAGISGIATIQVISQKQAGTAQCAAQRGVATPAMLSLQDTPLPGFVALQTAASTARFHSVFVTVLGP